MRFEHSNRKMPTRSREFIILENTVYYNCGIVGNKHRKEPQVIDLFCGVGGLTHGFVREGFKVLVGYDSDASCKFAYESNNAGTKFIHKEIENTKSKEIAAKYRGSGARILVGCAPCQPFSPYTVKQRKDEKWKLLLEFQRLIADVGPEVISMENVPELSRHPVFEEFVMPVDLQRVRICVLGVDGVGKDLRYWESLRQFWREYFREAWADLRCFSPLRDPSGFER